MFLFTIPANPSYTANAPCIKTRDWLTTRVAIHCHKFYFLQRQEVPFLLQSVSFRSQNNILKKLLYLSPLISSMKAPKPESIASMANTSGYADW